MDDTKTAEQILDECNAEIEEMVRNTPESLHHPERLIEQANRQRVIELEMVRTAIAQGERTGEARGRLAGAEAARSQYAIIPPVKFCWLADWIDLKAGEGDKDNTVQSDLRKLARTLELDPAAVIADMEKTNG